MTTTITAADALAACSYLIDWQPGGKHMISADIGEITARDSFYADGIEAVRQALRLSTELREFIGVPFDSLPEDNQDCWIGRTIIDWIGQALIDDDRDRLWDLLGIYHAHVVGHGSFQLAFVIGPDGVVKLETVQLWKHPEMTITEARETYTKALDNVWAQLQV